MKEEELKLLENEFCLGCARSCDLLHPSCERGLVKMQEILEEYKKRDDQSREFDSCLRFFANQIAQNVDYINAFEFFYCQIRENKCTNKG